MKTIRLTVLSCWLTILVATTGCGANKKTEATKASEGKDEKTRISKRTSIGKKAAPATKQTSVDTVPKDGQQLAKDPPDKPVNSAKQNDSPSKTTLQIINNGSNRPFPKQLMVRPDKPELIIKTKEDLAKHHEKSSENKYKYVEVEVTVGRSIGYSEVSQYEWEFPIREELKIRRITYDGYFEKEFGPGVTMDFQEGEPWKLLSKGEKVKVRGYYMISSTDSLLLAHCVCVEGGKGVGELTQELMDAAKKDEFYEMPAVSLKGKISGIRKDPVSLIDQLALVETSKGVKVELSFSPRNMKLQTGQNVEVIADYLTYSPEDDLFKERNPVRIDGFPQNYLQGK